MKKLAFIAAIAFSVVACKNNDATSRIQEGETTTTTASAEVAQTGNSQIEFDRTTHDFGNIENNESVETEFEVKNTGDADLIIINASASCGCTVPEYPKTPIKPGESEKIKVRFRTSAVGQQQKTVTLTTNTEKGDELLTIKANVAPKQE
ncbi:DUF1573 domain-containing protein [Myroides guanonis]|uniref:DUF1573 domain-containing protein n=1 Tax=Myroides guanonis TaxID=1150112 RepID=A0A1I3TFW8_9FLAO|nr:DUF1573 domain-containing protein [Myroides guanonis]SFJ68561.1 Protein of unknown function [Myroides guanonis]